MAHTEGKCAVCGKNASQYCSACQSVHYCSADHQRNHWKTHKLSCRAFIVSTADDVGRFLLANRDIKKGSIILTEFPLVVGPKWFLNEAEESLPIVPCVGCYTPVKVGIHFCPRCTWPACSPTCAGLDNTKLHALECPLLMLGPGPSDRSNIRSLMDYYRTDSLIVLKCLMLQRKFPKKWKELLDMQSHEIERINSELYNDVEKRIVSFLQNNFLKRLKAMEKQSKQDIVFECDANILHKICGIIETNYMCIRLQTGLELSGIFYTGCMMEHSCIPNCYFTFDHSNGFRINVTAGREIKKGEHFKIMYSNMLWGTQLRQEHLSLTKHFSCKCERCSDRTELGTYLSGLRCIGPENASCGGVQLPEDPLQQNTDWICDKCPVKINSTEVRYIMTQMGEEVDLMLSKKGTVRQIEDLIDKLSQFVHKNHYHLFNLKHCLIQLYGTQSGYQPEQLSDELLLKKISICENLLEICDKLDPFTIRLSLYVGIILNEMQSAVIEYNKRKLAINEPAEKESAIFKFEQAKELLERAKSVLEKESDTPEGIKLSETTTKSLENVEGLLAKSLK